MTLDDQEPPVRRISRAEERERLLAETLAHVEAQEAQYRLPIEPVQRQPMWKKLVAVLLFVVAGYFAFYPPTVLRGPEPPTPSIGQRMRGVRAALYLQAQQVEAFRVRTGRLPATLSQVAVRIPDIEYVRSNSRTYQLVARGPGGRTVVYDSAVPSPAYAALVANWGLKGHGL